jgi:putative FmdB family regulatory protein
MPHYVFLCRSCKEEFTKVLHIDELEESKVSCPHCGGKDVRRQVAMFSAVTSKKS